MPPGGRSLRRWPSAAGPMAARCLSGADARRRSRERDVRVKDTRRNFSVRSPMIVLGISETHCATAAILRDGEIVGCASEERFSRLKNDAGYPRQAVDALLRELRLTAADIDVVALAGLRAYSREWMNRVLHDAAYAREYYGVGLDERRGLARRARKLGARLGLIEPARGKFDLTEGERLDLVTSHLGLPRERILTLRHHLCHAAAAYYGAPFTGQRALVLTND